MAVYRSGPTYDQPLEIQGVTSKVWYRFFQAVDTGTPPSNEIQVTPQGSPYTYSAKQKGVMVVSGSGVTNISVSRTPGVFYSLGTQVNGAILIAQNDQMQVTYTAPPVMTWLPQ